MRSVVAVTLALAVLHLWALFQGLSNLIALPGFYAEKGLGEPPWWLLVAGVLLPVVTFTAAVLLGRGRILSHRVLLLVISLAAANAFVLSSGALAPILLAFQART
ncbi:MAG: hypothetical protein JWP32_166 [Schumannella sp.]|nr:hypothetical protein [Schumannella sp.]